MVWSRGLPLGLLTVTHPFTLTKQADGTILPVRRTSRGPLRFLARKAQNRSDASLVSYVDAVKYRAELLSAHFGRAGVPAQRSAGHNDADTQSLQLAGPSH
ncbi:MAG: Polyketide cyclase / dehydrase and lipid transport [Pseudarthrobacter sp.]|nr:Polyketide cyclase / dehydrase and lipid transport [Pseudarthrobacter sp.]